MEHAARLRVLDADQRAALAAVAAAGLAAAENHDPVADLAESYGEPAGELAARDPRSPAATWHESDQTVGFWSRRMTQETAVHRVDAQAAAEVRAPVDEELATDGVDELLRVFAEGDWSDLP